MAKRKRGNADTTPAAAPKVRKQDQTPTASASKPPKPAATTPDDAPVWIQIVTGSYERVLHGIAATIPSDIADKSEDDTKIDFTDTFLFNAHASSIRCLAISPPSTGTTQENQRVTLASGGTDQRINLYHLSTAPPTRGNKPQLPTLSGHAILENRRNKELGSLLHHSSTITALHFPTASKLMSGSEDNTIAIARASDWTVLSIIKAPIPKAQGRPSGDTAAPGEVPAGVNDFAVHPSMKLMVSVGKGERSMRLWNLVTGKKAGVLNFERDMLQQVGEGKYGTGEGRKVIWGPEGEEFVVGFERGAVVYGLDSKPKAKIFPSPLTKVHQIRYLPKTGDKTIVAVSTEDGRILFYSTDEVTTEEPKASSTRDTSKPSSKPLPSCKLLAQLGGAAGGVNSRIKDFEILMAPARRSLQASDALIITGSSNGSVRIWLVRDSDLQGSTSEEDKASDEQASKEKSSAPQIGKLIGMYETGNRITCLRAFEMTGKPEETPEGEAEVKEEEESSDSDDSDDSE